MLKNKLLSVLSAMGGSEPPDPYFKNTVLLLHGDGTNGAQNNTFIDSSPNNFAIARYGNVTQGSFSPFSKEPGKWGVAFNGNGGYLSVPNSAVTSLGSQNYTFEAWIKSNATTSDSSIRCVFSIRPASAGFQLISNTPGYPVGTLQFWPTGSGGDVSTVNKNVYDGAWHHVACVRNGNNFTLYVDGVAGNTTTVSATYSGVSRVDVGQDNLGTDGRFWNGYISNVRLVVGTALYTTNFTPSTALLTAVPGTSLLCCQDNRFKDNSSNNFTLTPYGNVAVTPFSPFANSKEYSASVNGGSGYLYDGGSNRLSLDWQVGSPLDIRTGDFTLEAWVYITNVGVRNGGGNYVQSILSQGTLNNRTSRFDWQISMGGTNGTYLEFYDSDGGGNIRASAPLFLNTWYHIACVRSGNTISHFLNGSKLTNISGGSVTTIGGTAGYPMLVGYLGYTGYPHPFFGYISNLRIVKGTALYTSNFTPPTAPLTAVTNTSLLLNFTNAGIIDSTGMNNLETVGNAQVSTTQKKFGTGAMYFDGNGDVLTHPGSVATSFGTGDFTIEAWIYPIAYGSLGSFIWCVNNNSLQPYLSLHNGKLAFGKTGAFPFVSGGSTIPMKTWTHVAVVRASGTLRLYVNGVLDGSTSDSSNYSDTVTVRSIGSNLPLDANWNFTGYIDDLRITKGVARYTANFTPPARAFPNK